MRAFPINSARFDPREGPGFPRYYGFGFYLRIALGTTRSSVPRVLRSQRIPRPKTQKPHLCGVGFLLLLGSLTITYFHTGIRTIIGVESFHGPVRDGKGWDRLAMVIRHDLLSRGLSRGRTTNREEVAERRPLVGGLCCFRHNTDLEPCVLRPPSGVHTHPLRGSDQSKR